MYDDLTIDDIFNFCHGDLIYSASKKSLCKKNGQILIDVTFANLCFNHVYKLELYNHITKLGYDLKLITKILFVFLKSLNKFVTIGFNTGYKYSSYTIKPKMLF